MKQLIHFEVYPLRILVTGCAGFIGSHAVECFLEKDYQVVGVDCLTYAGKLTNMSNFLDQICFYQTDICEKTKIENIVNEHAIKWIVNFAAETHVDNSILGCDSFIHSNIIGVKSLLEVCRKTGAKLLQVSTDEVYGSTLRDSFDEDSPLAPANPYSATKAAAEHLIRAYGNTHSVEHLIVRPSNNFGPRQDNEKFIPTILRGIDDGDKIPLYGDGKNVRDWLYVKETARAIEFIIKHSPTGMTYNISSKQEIANIDLLKKICDIKNISFNDSYVFVDDRPGHDFRYSITSTKIKELGYKFDMNWEKSLKETINYFFSE